MAAARSILFGCQLWQDVVSAVRMIGTRTFIPPDALLEHPPWLPLLVFKRKKTTRNISLGLRLRYIGLVRFFTVICNQG